ncbi:MAG: polysaccharide deacetylase family protein [Bacteroidia bacterium]|nr:polysaccharide deacetylase family protein [Bacteroidia bacterium]
MTYIVKSHPLKERLKTALGQMEFRFRGLSYPSSEIVVVNYHGTQRKHIQGFREQLSLYKDHFHLISPKEFEAAYSNKEKADHPSLLLTFDDGLKNNLHAAEALNTLGLKAWFFVLPAFIDTPPPGQKLYFQKHIRPLIDPELDSEAEDHEAMNWNDLNQLVADGHSVGSHSYTHNLLANHPDLAERIKEIAESRSLIAERLAISADQVKAFCCPNNTAYSTGVPEMQLIRKHYSYFFGSYPGSNINRESYHIRRSNVECYWTAGQVYWALNRMNRLKWRKESRNFDRLMNNVGSD